MRLEAERLADNRNLAAVGLAAGGGGGGQPVVAPDGAQGELFPAPEDGARRRRRAVAAGTDNRNWHTYSDTVPVYSVGVNTWADEGETVPFSSLYNHVAERITDPNATGALGALVKGSTMKDSASVITIVKHMQRGNGSYRDEAPLVRAYNMLTATAAEGSPPDPITYKWMRNFKPAGLVQLEIFQGRPVGGSVIAVPHDMFTEYVFLNFNTPFPGIGDGVNVFSLDSMDDTWVAIPVSNDLLRTKALIPYMLSFLTSGYTNGTVNHIVHGEFTSPQHEGQTMQYGSYRTFPRSNLAYVPGAIHAILVLTDCTTSSAPDSIRGIGYEIPVANAYRRAAEGVPLPAATHIDDLIRVWWVPFNAAAGGSDIVTAINEIESKLAVGGVAKRASSVAAELHGAQYPPMMVAPDGIGYDLNDPLTGAWVLGGDPNPNVYPQSEYAASRILPDNDLVQSRRLMVGYNFGAVSPLARPYSGFANTEGVPSTVLERHRGRRWSDCKPAQHAPAMTLKTMDSMSRVATYMGLVITEDIQNGFTSAEGTRSWFRMLAMAVALQTAVLFARSDLSLLVWTGYEAGALDLTTRNTYTQFLRMATNGLCGYIDIPTMIEPWHAWDEDCTAEYYGIDPFTDTNWYSYHPVPCVLTTQWSRKLSLPDADAPQRGVFRYLQQHRKGLFISHERSGSKLECIGTIDFTRYAPVVIYPDEDNDRLRSLGMWVESDAYITNSMTGAHASQPKTVLMSGTPAISTQSLATEVIEPRRLYVLFSNMEAGNHDMTAIRVTDIQYPDPITLDSLISAAKNYLLYPALSAVLGFMSGGPTGAVVAGTSHIISQAVKDLVPKEHADVVKEVIDKTKERVVDDLASGSQ